MKHVIVYAHPNPKSFSASIRDHIHHLSRDLGNSVTVRDLYHMNFNPVLSSSDFQALQKGITPKDIHTEQDIISAADLITVIFPLWWSGYPAILKGWIDRVLQHGFAFKYSRDKGATPLLTNKKIQLITTMGASVDEYENNGMIDAMAMTLGDNVWSFCGCMDAGMIVLGEVPGMSDQDRMAVLTEIEDTLVLAMATDKSPSKSSKAKAKSSEASAATTKRKSAPKKSAPKKSAPKKSAAKK
jgi:NAD(P)H dehydrogenase (quinone)